MGDGDQQCRAGSERDWSSFKRSPPFLLQKRGRFEPWGIKRSIFENRAERGLVHAFVDSTPSGKTDYNPQNTLRRTIVSHRSVGNVQSGDRDNGAAGLPLIVPTEGASRRRLCARMLVNGFTHGYG